MLYQLMSDQYKERLVSDDVGGDVDDVGSDEGGGVNDGTEDMEQCVGSYVGCVRRRE